MNPSDEMDHRENHAASTEAIKQVSSTLSELTRSHAKLVDLVEKLTERVIELEGQVGVTGP